MITLKKTTENKVVTYLNDVESENVTSINFRIYDGDTEVGDGVISAPFPGQLANGLNLTLNLHGTDLIPEDIFERLPALIATSLKGGAK